MDKNQESIIKIVVKVLEDYFEKFKERYKPRTKDNFTDILDQVRNPSPSTGESGTVTDASGAVVRLGMNQNDK